MILTITSLKGGTGKTTLSALRASYLARCLQQSVILVDLDPQAGATALFLDGKGAGPGSYDLLQQAAHQELPPDQFRAALCPSPYCPNVYLLSGDPRLNQLLYQEIQADALRRVLESADLAPETEVLIDTGTARTLVEMGIAAADAVLVPMMLSPQTIKPTVHTLAMVQRAEKPLAGLMPVGAGSARWEAELLAGWARTLANRFADLLLLSPAEAILPALPQAKALVRGQWVASAFPERLLPTFQALEQVLATGAVLPVGEEQA